MSRKIWPPVVLAAVLVVVVAGGVFGQTATPPTPGQAPSTATPGQGKGFFGLGPFGFFGGGQGKSNWTQFDAVASALGLTPAELFQNLHDGKSLTEIATAQGKDIAAVQQAAQAAQTQAVRSAINQAVKDGRITQDQGNWMVQGIDKGWSHGFGGTGMGGRGFGGHRGMFRNQQATPSAQPNAQPSSTPSM